MLMYESASISVTFFSNMAAYRGGFEDEDDEDSCMSNAHFHEKTTKVQFGKLGKFVAVVLFALLERRLRARHTVLSEEKMLLHFLV